MFFVYNYGSSLNFCIGSDFSTADQYIYSHLLDREPSFLCRYPPVVSLRNSFNMAEGLDASALMRLPEEIASVQSQLQWLDEGVGRVLHDIKASEESITANQAGQHALQSSIKGDLKAVAVLELQNRDLQTLVAVRQQQISDARTLSKNTQVTVQSHVSCIFPSFLICRC